MDPLNQAVQSQQPATPNLQDQVQANINAVEQMQKKKKQQDLMNTPPSAISQAVATLNPNSTDPQAQIGKAIATPAYAGKCLRWVDDQQGNQNRQPTAIADYQTRAQAGQISNSTKIPDGARTYFSADQSNGNMGHVGIYNAKSDTFTSATDNGIKSFSIPQWEKYTGQQLLGWSK